MIVRTAVGALLLAASACATVAPAEEEVPVNGGGSCDAAKAQSLVGRQGSDALAAEARKLSGASIVRWLRPGEVVTMEYRADRLNIEVDAQNKVIGIRCG